MIRRGEERRGVLPVQVADANGNNLHSSRFGHLKGSLLKTKRTNTQDRTCRTHTGNEREGKWREGEKIREYEEDRGNRRNDKKQCRVTLHRVKSRRSIEYRKTEEDRTMKQCGTVRCVTYAFRLPSGLLVPSANNTRELPSFNCWYVEEKEEKKEKEEGKGEERHKRKDCEESEGIKE